MSDKSVFLTRMPAGIAGTVTREEMAKKEPQLMSSSAPCLYFGIPVVMASGKVTYVTAEADVIRGFLIRSFPTQEENINYEDFAEGTPPVKQPCDILRSGYMMVKCLAGVPALDGKVYVRWGTDSGVRGTIEAETSGDQVAVTGAYFMGEADADGNVEIVYNI